MSFGGVFDAVWSHVPGSGEVIPIPDTGLHTWLRAGYGYTFNDPTLTAETDFSNAAWTKTNISVSGSPGAQTLTATSTSSVFFTQTGGNHDTAIDWVISVTAKAGTASFIRLSHASIGNSIAWFDLSTGTVGTVQSAVVGTKMEDLGGGVYRCSVKLGAAPAAAVKIGLSDSGGSASITNGATVDVYEVIVQNGKLSTWTSQDATNRTFSQATAANQPIVDPLGNPEGNDELGVYIQQSVPRRLPSDEAEASWAFLISGAGCSVYVVHRPSGAGTGTGRVISCRGSSRGSYVAYDADNAHHAAYVEDSGGPVLSEATANGSTPDQTVYVASWRLQDTGTGDSIFDVGGENVSTNDATYAASPGDPSETFCLGARTGGNLPYDGHIYEVIIYDRRLDDAEDAQVVAYLRDKFECELSVPNNVLYLRADRGVTLNGSDVVAIADQGPQSNDASQGTAANQPAFNASDSDFGGQPSISHTAANSEYLAANGVAALIDGDDQPLAVCMSVGPGSFMNAGSFWGAGNSAGTTPYIYKRWDTNSRFVTNKHDGTTSTQATSTNGTVDGTGTHVYVVNSSGTATSHYEDGTDISNVTAQDVTAVTFDRFAIGALVRSIVSAYATLKWNSFAVYSQVLTTYQESIVRGAQQRRVGL